MNSGEVLLVCGLVVFSMWSLVRYGKVSSDSIRARKLNPNTQDQKVQSISLAQRDSKKKSLSGFICALLGGVVGLFVSLISGASALSSFIIPVTSGIGGGWLLQRVVRESQNRRAREDVEFYIPVFMEQVVMAVQAGLDIIPAIRAALDIGACGSSKLKDHLREVLELTERGMPFISSLDEVARRAPTQSVRHAFMHLKLAFSQGGELIRPLRELSDATQLQYQEGVEEEIAKLPVKAVLPLVCTFAGLMVCFLTVPLVQLSSITKKVAPQLESAK